MRGELHKTSDIGTSEWRATSNQYMSRVIGVSYIESVHESSDWCDQHGTSTIRLVWGELD